MDLNKQKNLKPTQKTPVPILISEDFFVLYEVFVVSHFLASRRTWCL